MAPASNFTPKASLTEAPTNLKEAIDWVLRVTGRDGKALNKDNGECICGLAAAVTDLLQSVQLEYNGYEGETKGTDDSQNKGASQQDVTDRLNELFSLVQGLGGTSVVRTYIDQLAQVLSALVGWSKIEKCWGCKGSSGKNGDSKPHGGSSCTYLPDKEPENKCDSCGCMKWNVTEADKEQNGHHLGRGCQRCSDDKKKKCECGTGGGTCSTGKECKCAKKGKCCKCCCKGQCDKCKDAKCSCMMDDSYHCRIYKDTYQSAYASYLTSRHFEQYGMAATWNTLDRYTTNTTNGTPSERRQHCARIFLGSVCLIWSGVTYLYWTGKYHKSSPRWNNHILDGSGLDDGTLSQWLQALGFPKEMLNNSGPKNRLDKVIWDGIMGKLYLGFPDTSDNAAHGNDNHDNTFRNPSGMNYAGYIHTVDRGAFHSDVFKENGNGVDKNKLGALFKLYILSGAYFTGLQKRNSTAPSSTNNSTKTPRTIREILYWLSALPYSQAYKDMLTHAKKELEKASPTEKKLSFKQDKRPAPITVDEYNLFAHFQAVTQYCPLVLIGIQGGLHSPKGTDSTKDPAIHSLYANTECQFTYPTVSIQAYNQVVHYIRALFYQLYFLRKQCAVKVAMGGKWRECRYGNGVESKGVISWMCLGCNPMDHDRKSRVKKVKDEILKGVKEWKDEAGENTEEGGIAEKLKEVLEKIGEVVVQLGNTQEALERKEKEEIKGVKQKLGTAKQELVKAREGLKNELGLDVKLKEAKKALGELTNGGGSSGSIDSVTGGEGLGKAKDEKTVDPGKNRISAAINKVREVLTAIQKELPAALEREVTEVEDHKKTLLQAIEKLKDICNSPKCPPCHEHAKKCGRQGVKKTCDKCHQQYMDGFPSPLQAFLEDRLPGFSCNEVLNTEDTDKYPPAASHLGHCNGSGQCCPLPMGFRGQFQERVTNTGHRLYGILYFFSNENMMQSCVYTLVRVTAALSATTPQVLGDVFGFFRGGVGEKDRGKTPKGTGDTQCQHDGNPKASATENESKYFCGWCASGLRDEVQKIEWIPKGSDAGGQYMKTVGQALIEIKGDKDSDAALKSGATTTTSLSALTENCQYLSPLTGELYTAVSATFGGTYLSWVLYLSDALEGGLQSLASEFLQIECRGCRECDPNKCKKGSHGNNGDAQCQCQSIVSCTGVLPVLYRHGFSYGNPFNLEGYQQKNEKEGDYSIDDKDNKTVKHCHEFLESLSKVLDDKKDASQNHPLTKLLSEVGQLQYDIRLPWIFVLTVAWLVAVLYLAFGAIWPLDWTHMRSHWLRGGAHQWQCMWYKVMTGRKGVDLMEYFGRR